MSAATRWRNRLRVREDLLLDAQRAERIVRARWKRTKPGTWPRTAAYRALVAAKAKAALRRSQVAAAKRVIARHSSDDHLWGGSRGVTNEIIAIVDGRAEVSSRKRTETFGNPGSDHHVSQTLADAVDFRIVEAHSLKNEISRKLGGPRTLPDYANFVIKRGGQLYRVQGIAGTHGTGPHLHFGVKRVSS